MKTKIVEGIEFLYRPGIVYTGEYLGYTITARWATAVKQWRLAVSKNNGGSLAFDHQFHVGINNALKFGKELVDKKFSK